MTESKQKFHFIAIGGSVMHGLAIEMKILGHEVTGSDDTIYDPSKSRLQEHGLLPDRAGWDPDLIHTGLSAVILGMHAHTDNPELLRAQELDVAVYSFPEFVDRYCMADTRIVIAGSHGKTTISAMLVHVLNALDMPFDYLLGAEVPGVEGTVRLRGDKWMIFEGDEYLSSRIDLRPKFLHYNPDILVLSGIAWDHFNVFPTMELYIDAFRRLVQELQPESQLIFCNEETRVRSLVERSEIGCRRIPYRSVVRKENDQIELDGKQYPVSVFGKHNDQNMGAAIQVLQSLGVSLSAIGESISSFVGARRRLEKIAVSDPAVIAYRDYAHSPSKLRATVDAVRSHYVKREVVAVYELHTYSSMSEGFLGQYTGTLDKAHRSVVFYDSAAAAVKRMPLLDQEVIKGAFGSDSLEVVTKNTQIFKALEQCDPQKVVFLFMSSGNFGGADLEEWLESQGSQ